MRNLSIKILLLLLLFTQLLASEKDCEEMVETWLEHPENVPMEVYSNSGKFLNDLGDYNNCLFYSDIYTYFTMRVYNKLVGLQYMGLCAPNQCRTYINSNQYSKDVENQLNDMYKKKTGSSSSIFFNLYFYIPVEEKPHFDWSNYLVVGLLSLIVVIGIAGSIVPKITDKETMPVRIIKCFSFYDNFKKIMHVSSTNENQNLLILNGMRVLSIFWIVFGHDMWFRFMNIKNWMETIQILQTPGLPTLVPAAYFAVDTFFWIGGFLVTIGLLDQMVKAKSFIKFYFGAVLHRFIRIWPTYMLAILIFWKIAPYMGSGPIWNGYSLVAGSCNNGGILWNMFFLDNFADHGPAGMDYCFGWGWYLAVDFQLFLLTPFLILGYIKNKKIGWSITLFLFWSSIICAFVLIYVNDWRYPIPNPNMKPQPKFMDDFYFKPYVRASAYFMGIMSGFIYYEWKNENEHFVRVINKIKRSIPIRIGLYVVGIGLCEFIIWIIMPFQTGGNWSTLTQAFYNSLNRVIFILGMYCCIFAAMFGCKNDPSKFILGHRFFSPLAKVSFCVYLMHLIVIMGGTFAGRMDLYWTPYTATFISISDIFWAVVAATCLSLLIESPTLGLEKIFLRGGKKKEKQGNKVEFSQFKEKSSDVRRESLLTEEGRQIKNSELIL